MKIRLAVPATALALVFGLTASDAFAQSEERRPRPRRSEGRERSESGDSNRGAERRDRGERARASSSEDRESSARSQDRRREESASRERGRDRDRAEGAPAPWSAGDNRAVRRGSAPERTREDSRAASDDRRSSWGSRDDRGRGGSYDRDRRGDDWNRGSRGSDDRSRSGYGRYDRGADRRYDRGDSWNRSGYSRGYYAPRLIPRRSGYRRYYGPGGHLSLYFSLGSGYRYGSPYSGRVYGYRRYVPTYGDYVSYGDVRLKVRPRDAAVYVDGYYAGIVDDFDGFFQRLTLEVGPHEIEIAAPSGESRFFDVYVDPYNTVDLHGDLDY